MQRQHLEHVGTDGGVHLLQGRQIQFRQILAQVRGRFDGMGHHLVGIAKGHAFLDQVVGQVGGGGIAAQGGLLHGGCIDLQGTVVAAVAVGLTADHFGKDAQGVAQRVHGVEQGLLVFLVVLVVGQGLTLHEGDQAHQVAHHPTGLAAREFRHVRVFLLRHDRTAGGETIGDAHETEVLAAPENQFLGEPADVHHDQAGSGGEFDREIPIRNGIQAVLAQTGLATLVDHAQAARHMGPVQRIAGAGQGRCAQGKAVDAAAHILKSLGVAGKHLDIGQQVVPHTHRLGHLQVREARQDGVGVLGRHPQQGPLQLGKQRDQVVELVAQPQAHVGGHLVVAAAPRVQALASIAHELCQARLDVEVDVLEVELPVEGVAFDFRANLGHATLDCGQIVIGNDRLRGQHARMGERSLDVGAPEAAVEIDTGRVAFDEIAHRLREQGRPALGLAIKL